MSLSPTLSILQQSNTVIPWKQLLLKSFEASYSIDEAGKTIDEAIITEEWAQKKKTFLAYLSMSNLKRSGDVSMHCIQFKGFLEQDFRFFKFLLAMNDNILMGDIKSDPNAKLSWTMPKSKEYFNFKGKFYIASAPIQVTRFPPPKITDDETPAADFWEKQRVEQWKNLDPKSRAVFTWPSRGDMPKAADKAFTCQSLDENDASVVHDIAMDNFCLLLYKVTEVEHFNYSTFPPKRTVYKFNAKGGSWDIQTANP